MLTQETTRGHETSGEDEIKRQKTDNHEGQVCLYIDVLNYDLGERVPLNCAVGDLP